MRDGARSASAGDYPVTSAPRKAEFINGSDIVTLQYPDPWLFDH